MDPRFEELHQPVRLQLMALLYQRGDVGAVAARIALDATPGNLDAHARRLVAAGFVTTRKSLVRSGLEVRYRMTPSGRAAFESYLEWLESFLKANSVQTGSDQPLATRQDNGTAA